MLAVEEVVAGVGSALLRVVVAGAADRVVTDVVIADLSTDDLGSPGDLVLGAGLADPGGAATLVRDCARREVSALVLGKNLAEDAVVRAEAGAAGLCLLAVDPAVSWVQLVWMLRSVVEWRGADQGPGRDAGILGDLFAVADAVAAIIGAPVTIEDSQSRVLAYSQGQDSGDPARHSTIVGRRVPAPVLARFRGQGVFRRMTSSGEPFFVPAEDDVRARYVFPVRAGEEWLGSIWAVVDAPVPDEQAAEVRRITAALAVHLLRLRAQAELARQAAEAELARILQEPSEVPTPQVSIGPAPWRVAALTDLYDTETAPRRGLELWRTTLRRHGWADPQLCVVHGRIHAVVSEADDRGRAGTWSWLAGLAEELHASDPAYRVAAGGTARTTSELVRSCAEAGEVLPVLADRAAATFEQTWAERVVRRVAVAVEERDVSGPISRLVAHDDANGTRFVSTLSAQLRWPGRPRHAAAELGIHPNTLRQRMARIDTLLQIDLECPDVRLALQLQTIALLDPAN